MKWYRMMMGVMALLLVAACANPVMPKYPEDEDDKKEDDPDIPDTAWVIEVSDVRFI